MDFSKWLQIGLRGFYFQIVRFIFINILSWMLALRIVHGIDGKSIALDLFLSMNTLTLRLTRYRLISCESELHCHLWMLLTFLVHLLHLQEDLQLNRIYIPLTLPLKELIRGRTKLSEGQLFTFCDRQDNCLPSAARLDSPGD